MNVYLEIFGYIGTALVIFSMTMTSVTKLRILNVCGSVISAIYAACNNTWPVVVLNVALICVNLFHLIRESLYQYQFRFVKASADEECVRYFLSYHGQKIETCFPNYRLAIGANTEIRLIWVGSEAIGILVGTKKADVFSIELDYAVPKYRDASVGKFIFSDLKKEGIHTLTAPSGSKAHVQYLRKLGFVDEGGIMVRKI